MKLVQLSENTIVILFEQIISVDIARDVSRHLSVFETSLSDYIIDIVPSYASIHILFDLRKVQGTRFQSLLIEASNQALNEERESEEKEIIEIPVYYDVEVGLDLEFIALSAKLSVDDVIDIHSSTIYDVYAMGFSPGFAYLGSVDQRIAMPRKETPRKHVPAGSLGIADQQTAIYPSDSPGGWQIVGRTPITLVNYDDDEPTKVKTGDQVRFKPINKEQYLELGGELESESTDYKKEVE
jgi:KipI family sensor histidine kinase inhibitor